MSDAAQAGGSPIELTMGGKTYKFAPLTLGDICDFEQWARSRLLFQSLAALGEVTSTVERVQMISAVMEMDIGRITIAEMRSFTGQRRQVWQSLRHHHPEITEEDVNELMSGQSIDELMAIVDSLSLPEGEESPPEAAEAEAGSPSSCTSPKPRATHRRR